MVYDGVFLCFLRLLWNIWKMIIFVWFLEVFSLGLVVLGFGLWRFVCWRFGGCVRGIRGSFGYLLRVLNFWIYFIGIRSLLGRDFYYYLYMRNLVCGEKMVLIVDRR